MISKGESRVIIGFFTFMLEYGVIILLALGLQFSSDFIFRMVTLYVIILGIFGHYRASTLLIWEEVRLLLLSHLCFFLSALLLIPMLIQSTQLILSVSIVAGGMLVYDILIAQALRHILYAQLADNVLIIGTGEDAQSLCNVCKTNRFSMMKVMGFVGVSDKDMFSEIIEEHQLKTDLDLYTINDLESLLQQQNIDQVIIAVPKISKVDLDKLMQILHLKVKKIKYVPLATGLVTFDSKVEDYDGLLVISSSKSHTLWPFQLLKRLIDIVGALFGCILLIPLSLYVRYENRKHGDTEPIFFIQERIGKDGKTFKIYKYRTMVPNAESVLQKLMDENPTIRKEYKEHKKLANDPRITKAGEMLRKKSLDEMPQLINVLRGNMSLVGPRPYLPNEKDDMGIYYNSVIRCKPGITGMWQSHGRSEVSFEDRCKLDDYYYSNWNLWLDITILIKTVKVVLYGKGAV